MEIGREVLLRSNTFGQRILLSYFVDLRTQGSSQLRSCSVPTFIVLNIFVLKPLTVPVDILCMAGQKINGFTLIELLVALAVAAILLGIGIPSFSGAIKNSRVSSDYAQITQALYLARSEAVKSFSAVTVCPRAALNATQCGTDSADWKFGWLVFVDEDFARTEASATINDSDEIISVYSAPRSDNSIEAVGSNDKTASSASNRRYIRYEREGTANWANGSFLLCNDSDAELSRVLNVAPTGDVRPGRPSGTKYPRDVFNREACK